MAGTLLKKRELYIDVTVNEAQVEEIFFYQVDFFKNQTFRTKEFLYKKEEVEVQEVKEGEDAAVVQPPEPLELFKEQWELFCREDIPTEVYATDAMRVMNYVFEPLMKKYPDFKTSPEVRAGREFLHDCVSMGRVISMSVFDEEQYLSANIRRYIKERYHDYVDEIKAERREHIFIRQTIVEEMPVVLLLITDADYKLKKQVMLNRGIKEETFAVRVREILALYPEADVIVDTATPEMYRLFRNINQYMDMENRKLLFSMESMLAALGKTPDNSDMIKTYLLYIRNQEEMRLGTFLPERLYSIHSFYLPVQLSEEKAWKKQFESNTIWKQDGRESYHISTEGELKGKYIVKAGKEQFLLKLRKVSIQRYMKKYAVLRLDVENYCYPGKEDRERINTLAACLFSGEAGGVDSIELKLKESKQAYSLTTVPQEGNENQLWINGLLQLGGKNKKQEKKALALSPMKEQMYCVETLAEAEEEQLIQMVLIRDGIFRKIEDALAKAMKPENSDRPVGSLLKRQKREIKELFEMYRYIVVSFGESYECTQKEERRQLWVATERALGTTELIERLQKKFALFF
ncbi:MAG: hypothetical protein J6K04_12105 [Lachnospiraceae bacterium]|nr:hypothetical protein [Lachnospiraceae bacterium]